MNLNDQIGLLPLFNGRTRTLPISIVVSGVCSVGYTTTARNRRISVLNHCLEWDKFVPLTLTYPTPDSGLTYTYFAVWTVLLYVSF